MRGLAGLRVLVTGAGGGIGTAVADRLLAEGAHVVGMDLHPPRHDGLAAALAGDVTDDADVAAAVESAQQALGAVDALVAAAGTHASAPTHELSTGTFRSVVDASLLGTFTMIRALLPGMRERGHGRIVTFGSTASVCAAPGLAAYAAAKGGVLAFTRSVAVEYAAHGIRANCLCPGGTATPMVEEIDRRREGPDEFRAAHPVGRYAAPPEVASGVAYLLSDDASFVVGATFMIDGGFSAR